MLVFFEKIRDFFSDLWLDIELVFGKSAEGDAGKSHVRQMKKEVKPVENLPLSLRILRISTKKLLFFYDQMATLVGSGITLIDSLSIVQAQTHNKTQQKLFSEMIHHINTGMSLAETMYLFPRIFPHMQAALIEAGEKSGNLKEVLAQIVEEMEAQQEFARKVKGAMFYPVILIVLAIGMVAGMMIFVIPKISELYKQSNVPLPRLTQIIIGISDYLVENYIFIFGGFAGLIAILWFIVSKTRSGRYIWENIVWITPVFGRISKEKNLMMLSANMSMLLSSGVLISDAFLITENTMDNIHYKKALKEIRHGIINGRNVSEMMGLEDLKAQKFKKNRLFPIQVAQMVHIGELTGSMAKMLAKIKQNYHKSIDYTLKNISVMIEPLMIFFVALLVGSVLMAVMLPFFYIGTTIS